MQPSSKQTDAPITVTDSCKIPERDAPRKEKAR